MSNACQGCGVLTESSLVCPTCSQWGRSSFFCTQECFAKNWDVHHKLHGILQHQQKIQAELESKPEPSRSSIGTLREKMYRPPREDEEMGNTKLRDVSPCNKAVPSYGAQPIFSQLVYFVKRRRWNARKRYAIGFGSLILFMIFVHFSVHAFSNTAVEEPEMPETEAMIIASEDAAGRPVSSMEDLQRQITKLVDQQAKHDQQISYIMGRFVEKADVVDPAHSALPINLVTSADREAPIAKPNSHEQAGEELQGVDHGAVVRAENEHNVLRPRVQDVFDGFDV